MMHFLRATENCPSPLSAKTQRRRRNNTIIGGVSRFIPKYKSVWKRLRVKVKSVLIFIDLFKHINLYGANSANLIMSVSDRENEGINFTRRATRLLELTERTITHEEIPIGIIHPRGRLKAIWSVILVVLLLYTAAATPFIIAFIDSNESTAIFTIETLVSCLFFVDFTVNLVSAYYDKNNDLVTNRCKIIMNYAKAWMIIDILSWFPFDIIQGEFSSGKGAFARFLRLPKLYRLLRLSRLLKLMKSRLHNDIMERIQEFLSLKSNVISTISSFLTILIFVHIVSCFWYFTARLYDFSPDTWVFRNNYQDSDLATLYLACLYWAVTNLSTVGYGDTTPVTILEIFVSLIWMGCGLYFFSFTIGNLASMMGSMDLKENALTNKLSVIEEIATEVKLSKKVKEKLKKSIRYSTQKRGFSWVEKMDLLKELPKSLRYEIALAMHQGAARRINFFLNKDQTFTACLVPMLQPMLIDKGNYIYETGSCADEIYFLVKGMVRVLKGKELVLQRVRPWKYFGNIEVVKKVYRKFDACSCGSCEILVMNKQALNTIEFEFHDIWQEISENALKKEKKIRRVILHLQEIKKVQSGEIKFKDFAKEYPMHIERLLQRKLKKTSSNCNIVSLDALVERCDELIKLAKEKKNVIWKKQFMKKDSDQSDLDYFKFHLSSIGV